MRNIAEHNYIIKEALLNDVAVHENNIKYYNLAVEMGCCQAM
jgi:hypothetical protein